MDSIAGNQGDREVQQSGLVDVTAMPLAELVPSDDSVLGNALRRLLIEMDQPEEIIAAFSSSPQSTRRG